MTKEKQYGPELTITLHNGCTLRCGLGEDGNYGGYVRIVTPQDVELSYWSYGQWGESPQVTMRDIFGWVERFGKETKPQKHEDPVADALMSYGQELSQTPGNIDGESLKYLSTGTWLKLAQISIDAYKKENK